MPTWTKITWIIAIIVNGLSIIWFLLGVTANFQRSLDLVSRLTFIIYWIPSLILVVLSIWMLFKKWVPSGGVGYGIVGFVIFLLILLSYPLFEGVRTSEWLHENVQGDPNKLTRDGKLEYRLEIVDFRQKNSYERLYVKFILTGEEKIIPLEIGTVESDGLSRGRNDWGWAIMKPTEVPSQYVLNTTKYLNMSEKKFIINVETGTSERID